MGINKTSKLMALEDYSQRTKELELQRRFKTFFDLSTEAVFIHDLPSGAIVDVNQPCARCTASALKRSPLFLLTI